MSAKSVVTPADEYGRVCLVKYAASRSGRGDWTSRVATLLYRAEPGTRVNRADLMRAVMLDHPELEGREVPLQQGWDDVVEFLGSLRQPLLVIGGGSEEGRLSLGEMTLLLMARNSRVAA